MWATARKARKQHWCADCRGRINPGDIYLRHVAAPNDNDLGNEGWAHMVECRGCATRYSDRCADLISARAAS